jgi:hypothetical protein
MKLSWEFELSDVQAVQKIVDQQKDRVIVRSRIHRNVSGPLPEINHETVWQALLMCLLTSQQRSGPNSPVSRFLLLDPSPISLEECRQSEDPETLISTVLREFGGIRFPPTIAQRAAVNFSNLENGGWKEIGSWLNKLYSQRESQPDPHQYLLERSAAQYASRHFKGLGPKQARNFWQYLGLSRYEFVLDSRIISWLRHLDFPMPLSSNGLGDEAYYVFISDILRELCIRSDVLPCIFDAAVFTSFDREEWQEDAVVW